MTNMQISKTKTEQMIGEVAEDMTWLRAIDSIQTRSKCNLTNFNEWLLEPFYPVSSTTYINKTGQLLGAMVVLVTDEVCLARYDATKDALVIFDRNHMDNYGLPGCERQFENYLAPFGESAVEVNVRDLPDRLKTGWDVNEAISVKPHKKRGQ